MCRVRRARYNGSLARPRWPCSSCWTRRRQRSRASPPGGRRGRIHDRDRVGQLLGRRGLEPGEPVHRDRLDGIPPGLGTVGEPGLERRLGRPSTMSSSRAGPRPSRIGVRSMITVTYLSPLRVCRHTCSSTPTTATPSNRAGSLIRTRLPSARTASLAVFQATAKASATRATVRCWTTSAVSAHRSAARDNLARGCAALVVSCRHTRPQPVHRYRRMVTASVVGRHPNGSCASSRTTLSRGAPSQPQRRHHRSSSMTRQASTALLGSRRCRSRPGRARPGA